VCKPSAYLDVHDLNPTLGHCPVEHVRSTATERIRSKLVAPPVPKNQWIFRYLDSPLD
jgi:hypothetical protein